MNIMELIQGIRKGLTWVLVRTFKWTWKFVVWSGKNLWKQGVRGGSYLWRRGVRENGTVVIRHDSQGNCVSVEIFDRNGKNVKDGKMLDMTSYYKNGCMNGAPDHTVTVYRVKNINPFRRDAGRRVDTFGPDTEAFRGMEPDDRFSVREERWKYLNGLPGGPLAPDQRVLFKMFCAQQDTMLEQAALNVAIAEKRLDKLVEIIRNSAIGQDLGDFRQKLAQCYRNVDVDSLPVRVVEDLCKSILMGDPSLGERDVVDRLSSLPVNKITEAEMFYIQCLARLAPDSENSMTADIVSRYEFVKTWEQGGTTRFLDADDKGKAELVRQAMDVGCHKAVEQMAELLFMEDFNTSNIRSRGAYEQTVCALANACAGFSGEQPALLAYYNLIGQKRELSDGLTDIAKGKEFFDTPEFRNMSDNLKKLRLNINSAYASPQIVRLELTKVNNLLQLYQSGSISNSEGEISVSAADALAAILFNLNEVEQAGQALKLLSGSGILATAAMQGAMAKYMIPDEVVRPYMASSDRDEREQDLSVVGTDAGKEIRVDMEAQQGMNFTNEFGQRLEAIHAKYGKLIQADFEDRHVLPFPHEYMDDMMAREPETLTDIIQQVGAEAVAFRNGELTVDELAHCPCYEPYFTGVKGDKNVLAMRMTEFWLERYSPVASVEHEKSVEQPVTGDRELEASADTPLDRVVGGKDTFIEKMNSLVEKYHPESTFEHYCTFVCPGEKAIDLWSKPENQPVFIRMMNEFVAASMAYRNGEMTPEELVKAIPGTAEKKTGMDTRRIADSVTDRVMGIYEGRIHSALERKEHAETAVHRHGMGR